MHNHIDAMIEYLVSDHGDKINLNISRDSNFVWRVMLFSASAPMMPLFDYNGDRQLVGRGDDLEAAMNDLNDIIGRSNV